MIVVNSRYIVPNVSIAGKFYQNKNEPVTFVTFVPQRDALLDGTQFRCPTVQLDWQKVYRASQAFADLLNKGGDG